MLFYDSILYETIWELQVNLQLFFCCGNEVGKHCWEWFNEFQLFLLVFLNTKYVLCTFFIQTRKNKLNLCIIFFILFNKSKRI